MPWETARDWLLFVSVVLGGGLALAPRSGSFRPLEAWCAGIAAALTLLGGAAFAVHVLQADTVWIFLGHLAVLAALVLRRDRALTLWRESEVREAFVAWTLVSAGALALLACVFSYSGGGWTGDWEEHYQRVRLLLRLRTEDAEFRHLFTFPARPPLANLADAALLRVTGAGYARHQVFMLLLNSLAILPAAGFARTFGGGRAAAAATAALFLLNPLFLQNATYAWTKLITAFFVLAGLHLLFAADRDRPRTLAGLGLLTLGVLTHYSACVWLLPAGGVWLWQERARWTEAAFRRTAALAVLLSTALLAPWLAFAVQRYGLAATLGSNTAAVGAAKLSWSENLLSAFPKLWATLVPPFLRSFDRSLLDQANPWTHFRDVVFSHYQANLFLGAGLAGLVLLAACAFRPSWRPALPNAGGWWVALAGATVLGTAVHPGADPWGLAHICLQPLVLLGVALAAARLPRLAAAEERLLALGVALAATADYLLGIVLHYSATAMQLNRPPGQGLFDYAAGLSVVARFNLQRKIHYGEDYFADTVSLTWWAALVLFTAVFLLALLRTRRLARSA